MLGGSRNGCGVGCHVIVSIVGVRYWSTKRITARAVVRH